jgi:hypothetical protein
VSVALPVFVNVKLCVALVCPTVVAAKLNEFAGETVSTGAAGVVEAGEVLPPQPALKRRTNDREEAKRL